MRELVGEPRGQPVALRPRAGVHDRRPGRRIRQDGPDAAVRALLRRRRHDGERQVRAVEPGRDAHRIAQAEATDDVAGDLRRGGRRRGHDRLRPEPAGGVGEAEVVGPEVVPPLRHAVRLVDDEQADLGLPDPVEKAGRGEALGRDVEQPGVAGDRPVDRLAVGRGVLLGVDEADLARCPARERLDLILHQRDERGDDERQVGPHERGQLVTQRLARARGHDDQHVAPGHGRLHRLALARPEGGEAEHLAQRLRRLARARERGRRRGAETGQGRRDERVGQGHGADDHRPSSGRHRPPVAELLQTRDGDRRAGRGSGAGYARASGSSNASLDCDSPLLASGYSPEKQASQCVSRVPPIAA